MPRMYEEGTVTGMSRDKRTLQDKAAAFDQLTQDMRNQQTYDRGLSDAATAITQQQRDMMERARAAEMDRRMAQAYERATSPKATDATSSFVTANTAPVSTPEENVRREQLRREIEARASADRFESQPNAIPRDYNIRPLDLPPGFNGGM